MLSGKNARIVSVTVSVACIETADASSVLSRLQSIKSCRARRCKAQMAENRGRKERAGWGFGRRHRAPAHSVVSSLSIVRDRAPTGQTFYTGNSRIGLTRQLFLECWLGAVWGELHMGKFVSKRYLLVVYIKLQCLSLNS